MDITSLTGVVGQQSLLVIENTPEDVQEYSWHRGANDTEENLVISYNATSHSQQKGTMYSGQESVIPTGALLIDEPRLNDTGNYTVWAAAINDTQRATGWLEVQGEWAAAPCLTAPSWTGGLGSGALWTSHCPVSTASR